MPNTVYQQIAEAETIVSTLVKNIYTHDSYQHYLDELAQDPDKENKINKIHSTFSEVRVFNTSMNPLFLASDIGVLFDTVHIHNMTKNFTTEEKLDGYVNIDGSIKKVVFLTKYGIYRIIFNSKTKLSELFRSFIYKLLDDVINNDLHKMQQIMNELKREKPQLVNEAIIELQKNYEEYKEKYKLETERRKMIEYELNNVQKNLTDITIENNYNYMYINQLKEDKKTLIKKYNVNEDDEDNIVQHLKKKYMKEISIYIVNTTIISQLEKKLTAEQKKEEEIFISSYKKNYSYNTELAKEIGAIDEMETVYLTLDFNPHKEESDKLVYVGKEWVHGKESYIKLMDELKSNLTWFPFPGSKTKFIFRADIDCLRTITNTLLMEDIS